MENQVKKRLFIALNLPENIKQELSVILNKLKQGGGAVKWVKPENAHLTLHFLGYIDADLEKRVKLAMQSFQGKFGELNFKLGKLNAFPNIARPRVIFLEYKQVNSKSVFKLQELLGEKLIQLGIIADKRPWKPHLTLGRVEHGAFRMPQDFLLLPKAFTVNSFELMESILKPTGAKYREAASYKL